MATKSRLAKGLAASALALAAAGLAIELGVRALGIAPPAPNEDATGHALINYLETERNSEGFHDVEWTQVKPPGTQRILFIGDSFASGVNVPLANLMHTRVEAKLNERKDAQPIQLYNLSRAGWDTTREVDELRTQGLDPDSVVIVFFINDATQLDTNPLLVRKINARLNEREGTLNRISKAWDYVDWRLARGAVQDEMITSYLESDFGSDEQAALWERCGDSLAEAKALSLEHDFKLAVVIFPVLIQLDGEHALSQVYDLVEDKCAELDVPTLNLLPAFRGANPESLWVSPTNAHPNASAYARTIQPITDFLVESGLAGE